MLRRLITKLDKYVDPLDQIILTLITALVSYAAASVFKGQVLWAVRTAILVFAASSTLVGLYRHLDGLRNDIGVGVDGLRSDIGSRLDSIEAKLLDGLFATRAGDRSLRETSLEVAIKAVAADIVEAHAGGRYPLIEDLKVDIVMSILNEQPEFDRFNIVGDLGNHCCWFRFRISMDWTMRPTYRGVEEALGATDLFGPILVTYEETEREMTSLRLLHPSAAVFWPVSARIAEHPALAALRDVRFLRGCEEQGGEEISARIARYEGGTLVADTVGRWVAPGGRETESGLRSALRRPEKLTRFEFDELKRATLQTYDFACDDEGDLTMRVAAGHYGFWRINHQVDYVLPMKVVVGSGDIIRDNRLYTHPFSKVTSLKSMSFRTVSSQATLTEAHPPFVHCLLGGVRPRLYDSAWHIHPAGARFMPGDEVSFMWKDDTIEKLLK